MVIPVFINEKEFLIGVAEVRENASVEIFSELVNQLSVFIFGIGIVRIFAGDV
jgi:hypothetical protein